MLWGMSVLFVLSYTSYEMSEGTTY